MHNILKNNRNPNVFKLNLKKPEHSYLMGLIQTDGTLSKYTRNRGRLSIELKYIDRDILKKIAPLFVVHTYVCNRIRDTNFTKNYKSIILHVYAKEIRESFFRAGLPVGRKHHIIKPPKCPFSKRDYYRGILDGDGSLGYTKQDIPFVSLCTASVYIANGYEKFLYSIIKKRKTVKRNRRDNIFNITVFKEDAIEVVNFIYYKRCLALNRKIKLANKIRLWIRPKTMKKR